MTVVLRILLVIVLGFILNGALNMWEQW